MVGPTIIIAKSSFYNSISGTHSPLFFLGGEEISRFYSVSKIGNIEKGYLRHFFDVFCILIVA